MYCILHIDLYKYLLQNIHYIVNYIHIVYYNVLNNKYIIITKYIFVNIEHRYLCVYFTRKSQKFRCSIWTFNNQKICWPIESENYDL